MLKLLTGSGPLNGAGALNTLAVLHNQLAAQASVVFIATFLSAITFPGLAAYIASKSALKAQARTLAVELAKAGIRINLVSPGPTATPIWGSLGLDESSLNSVATSVCQRLLTGKFLEASAVADAIVFLLSDAARGIYGQDLVVDTGFTFKLTLQLIATGIGCSARAFFKTSEKLRSPFQRCNWIRNQSQSRLCLVRCFAKRLNLRHIKDSDDDPKPL